MDPMGTGMVRLSGYYLLMLSSSTPGWILCSHWPLTMVVLCLTFALESGRHVQSCSPFCSRFGISENEGSPKSSKSIDCFSIETTLVTLRQIPLHRTRGNILSLCPPKSKVFKHIYDIIIFHHWRNGVWVSVWHSWCVCVRYPVVI